MIYYSLFFICVIYVTSPSLYTLAFSSLRTARFLSSGSVEEFARYDTIPQLVASKLHLLEFEECALAGKYSVASGIRQYVYTST